MVVEISRKAQERSNISTSILSDDDGNGGGGVWNGEDVELRQFCYEKAYTFHRHVFETRQRRCKSKEFVCPSKLRLPLSPQVRYIGERVLEVFTAKPRGQTKVLQILHPNIHDSICETKTIDLTDGNPKHKLTARDVVERTPFSVHGTLDGRICVARSDLVPEESVVEVWRNEEPIINVKVNQLDNGFLAATTFQYVSTHSSLFVLDLASRSKISSPSRVVFKAVTASDMLDTCWLWDYPSRLVLSTSDSIRLFDIRSPSQTNQALFVDYGLTHLASNRYRSHVFAAFNGNEVQVYDSRQLFGPVQRIHIEKSKKALSGLKWNPYMPYELFVHFRDSKRVLRCNLPELGSDPFKRMVCDDFESEDVLPMEQVWEGVRSVKIIEERRKKYRLAKDYYRILTYGEMYDKCKEDPSSPMPLCWATPYYSRENRVVNEFVTPKSGNGEEASRKTDFVPYSEYKKVLENAALVSRLGGSDSPFSSEQTNFQSHGHSRGNGANPTGETVAGLFKSKPHSVVQKSISCTEAVTDVLTSYIRSEEEQMDPNSSGSAMYSQNTQHDKELDYIFDELGLDFNNTESLVKTRMDLDIKMNKGMDDEAHPDYANRCRLGPVLSSNSVDNGYRIRLPHKVYSFDVAPVGYSGIMCLLEKPNGIALMFAPFVSPDEGFAAKAEYADMLNKTKSFECLDAIPYQLYETMMVRLFRGMDYVDNQKPELSLFHGLANHCQSRWAEWLIGAARKQHRYNEIRDLSDVDDGATDAEDVSGNERNVIRREDCPSTPVLDVKGLPGILQLLTLETEKDVTWHDCDSIHFSFTKIARSPVRRMILAPYCLPISEERVISEERFAAGTDIPQQMAILYLCLINGDTTLFTAYTIYLRRKLGRPVHADNPCLFLNAFYFFSKVLSRYINEISGAVDQSSPRFIARKLKLADRIEAFVKENAECTELNPYFVPMLLIILGELTSTPALEYTRVVTSNERMPMSMRLAWCVNLLPVNEMKNAIEDLFRQCKALDRLQFVGAGRHPDCLKVLSDYIASTLDCQIVSHIVVAARCFEEDLIVEKNGSSESVNLSVEDTILSDSGMPSAPTLFAKFPTCYLAHPREMDELLHCLRAEFCRYAYMLQRMQKFCFRRKLLNLVPQLYWPEVETSVDLSCTFCGCCETAVRSNETNVSEQATQVRSRSSIGRGSASRSSTSVSGALVASAGSISISTSTALFDAESNSNGTGGAMESPSYDYNGVDGGTEAEIKRAPDSACPQCRKPFPRCALCGISYLTPVNDYDHQAGTFSMMFSFCLMCCHGGHTKHLIAWFEKEDVCPVLGCECRCIALENGSGVQIKQN